MIKLLLLRTKKQQTEGLDGPGYAGTRPIKIMRRVPGAIYTRNDIGDVTTLANPERMEANKKMAESDQWRTMRLAKKGC